MSKWINLTSYPPVDMNITPLYLASNGQANTLSGNGFLEWSNSSNNIYTNTTIATTNATSDSYTYDPANPRSVAMGSYAVNCINTENRSDVLVYTTNTLDESVMIIGPVLVELYAASDVKDTDFIARVLDVYPNGTAINLGPEECGVQSGPDSGKDLTKKCFLNLVKLKSIALNFLISVMFFLKGHKIRLEISSSAYPMLQPNPNTGNPIATDTQQQIAHQTIYHDQKYPSAVYLPIIPSNSSLYKQIFG